jgi:AmmeMemoRadiSam system protein A
MGKQLRGCCGTLIAIRPLAQDVRRNAWASAFADPRFSPVEQYEWDDIHLHISVLSPLEPIAVANEQALLDVLRPNIDGLVIERDQSRATFLPDVWEQIPASSWSPQIKVQRYTTESFEEQVEEHVQQQNSRRA